MTGHGFSRSSRVEIAGFGLENRTRTRNNLGALVEKLGMLYFVLVRASRACHIEAYQVTDVLGVGEQQAQSLQRAHASKGYEGLIFQAEDQHLAICRACPRRYGCDSWRWKM